MTRVRTLFFFFTFFILLSCEHSDRVPVIGGGYGIGETIDGKREGYWKFYRDNDSLRAEGNYKNGQAEGTWKFYHANGTLEEVSQWTADKVNGPFTIYHSNGEIDHVGEYSMDLSTG